MPLIFVTNYRIKALNPRAQDDLLSGHSDMPDLCDVYPGLLGKTWWIPRPSYFPPEQ